MKITGASGGFATAAAAIGLAVGGFAAGTAMSGPSAPGVAVAGGGAASICAVLSGLFAARRHFEAGRIEQRLVEQTELAAEAAEIAETSSVRLGEMLGSTLDLEHIRRLVLDVVANRLDAEVGVLFECSSDGQSLRAVDAVGDGGPAIPKLREMTLSAWKGVAGWVAVTGEPLTVPSVGAPAPIAPEPEATTALAVPIMVRNRTWGVLALYGRRSGSTYEPQDVDMVRQFVARASVAIENVHRHLEVQERSITDSLTGLGNRRYFEQRAREELERSLRFRKHFCVLMLDLDRFKAVNDRYGHRCGDEVLALFAHRLRANTREVDVCARYGGEEFVLLLPETDMAGGHVVAEKLRRSIAEEPFDTSVAQHLGVTVSIGLAAFPTDGRRLGDVIDGADQALYAAKRAGRNRVAWPDRTRPRPAASPKEFHHAVRSQ